MGVVGTMSKLVGFMVLPVGCLKLVLPAPVFHVALVLYGLDLLFAFGWYAIHGLSNVVERGSGVAVEENVSPLNWVQVVTLFGSWTGRNVYCTVPQFRRFLVSDSEKVGV